MDGDWEEVSHMKSASQILLAMVEEAYPKTLTQRGFSLEGETSTSSITSL